MSEQVIETTESLERTRSIETTESACNKNDRMKEFTGIACMKSLKFLCKEVLGMGDWSVIHDDLSRFLEMPARRKLILIPRGHLKSSIVTKGWTIQHVLKNPNDRVLIANAVWDNARKFLWSIENYLGAGGVLDGIFGKFQSSHWNQDECTIRQRKKILDAPTWTTTGIEKEQTSQHYDLIVADDLCTKDNSFSPESRLKVKEYYKQLVPLLDPKGMMVVIGTRKHQDDLYQMLMDSGKYDVFFMSAYKDEEQTIPVFPEVFSRESLDDIKTSLGSSEFASEFLNNPLDDSVTVFKKKQIQYYDAATLPPLSRYMTVDPAIRQASNSDYTAIMVTGMDSNHRIYVLDRIRRKMHPSESIEEIFNLVEKWKLTRIGIETYAFQLVFKYNVQDKMRHCGKFFSVDELRKPKTLQRKEQFVSRLQPYFEQGLVYLRKDMQDLEDELMAFPNGRHEDLLDCLAYSVDHLVPATAYHAARERHPMSIASLLERLDARDNGELFTRYLRDLRYTV